MLADVIIASLSAIEKCCAYLQGKGYGASSIRAEINLASKFLPRCPNLIVDVGANKGDYTSALRTKFLNTEIHSFEPSVLNIEKLHNRFKDDKWIFIVPKALANEDTEAVLYSDTSGSGLASLSKRRLEHFGLPFELSERIQVTKFESYWKNFLNSRSIDLIKLDIEGHELSALQGFGNALDHTNVIQFEFGGANLLANIFQDLFYFLTQKRFKLYRMTPFGLTKINYYKEADETFVTTNYLAINAGL